MRKYNAKGIKRSMRVCARACAHVRACLSACEYWIDLSV